ncbi:hypothetical protein CQ019_03385 [Arthrobacter sp. MYb229]|uniref:hypothetical protein n=1 Tax=unclassified Arthrobacter TaxID=235627 RepID=UPI000CFAAB12|nr:MULTISPECIES: hypothetical protein [unclassified Arthrobacter]PRA06443.1 hypothetical protein CQ019_03385 [Arthrobacter sp. MYb229]PRB53345.1 hypothetical protein CQ013_03385 [Arthrobacter sp. MYb216]
MAQLKARYASEGVRAAQSKPVPFYSVTEEEWRSIPRDIPNVIVLLASWLPLIALNVYLFRFAYRDREELELGGLLTFSVIAACVAVMWAACRIAPWLALTATAALYLILQPVGVPQLVLLGSGAFFGLLALTGLFNQLRFIARLRRWRALSTSTVDIPPEQRSRLHAYRQLPKTLWYLALGSMIYPLLKLVWQFFTDAKQVVNALDRDRIDSLVIGVMALALCLVVVLVRFIEQRLAGHLALEIPLARGYGPLSFTAVGKVVPAEPLSGGGCDCTDPGREPKTLEYGQFAECLDNCRVHGIAAVNNLSPAEFLRVADQPWVWGEHVSDRLVRRGDRMVIAGLSGWDSMPVRLEVRTVFGQGRQAAANYLPRRAAEPRKRQTRGLHWRDGADNTMQVEQFDPAALPEFERISLAGAGIDGYAVRVRSKRPFICGHLVG